ncbi:hypothetical protein LCGC14_0613900 [marine sediment metagenome]|uniref:Uncharacterized protein n=1 Tax=marine sediment metagenome TaxID=412755 RepID=A0A0F9R701_9ZZZZ
MMDNIRELLDLIDVVRDQFNQLDEYKVSFPIILDFEKEVLGEVITAWINKEKEKRSNTVPEMTKMLLKVRKLCERLLRIGTAKTYKDANNILNTMKNLGV